MKTITFEDEKYKLISRKENKIIFEKINEFESAEENASNHQKRIDEFRYCGYNEEDENFHGMCVYQNKLDNDVEKIEKKKFKILEEIERRLNYQTSEIMNLLNEYGVDY